MRRKYLAGNWKMNGQIDSLAEVAIIDAFAQSCPHIDVAIAPPVTLLTPCAAHVSHIAIGAQDCHPATSGAHTGCLSAAMLHEAGAGFAIVGHSERRADQFETSELIAAKAAALHAQEMHAILCVGESLEVRESGDAIAFVTAQLLASLPDAAQPEWLAIAYEPVWAIGTGRVAGIVDISEMHDALRAALMDAIGDEGENFSILYGGSVNGDNAAAILAADHVDGALVGGASLTAQKFLPILRAAAAL